MEGLAAYLAGLAILFAVIALVMSDSHDRRDRAFDKADRACLRAGKGNAESVDIQGQDRIAYVCAGDGGLRKLAY